MSEFVTDTARLDLFPGNIEWHRNKGERLHSWSVYPVTESSNGPTYFNHLVPWVAVLYERNRPPEGAEPGSEKQR